MPKIITRIWHGVTKTEHSDAYLTFLEESGLSDYKRYGGKSLRFRMAERLKARSVIFGPLLNGTRTMILKNSPARITKRQGITPKMPNTY
jgi:hypothetical protein